MSKLPSVKDAPVPCNCRFHFPQFEAINPAEFRTRLSDAIGQNSPNAEIYEKAVGLLDKNTYESYIEAVELAAETYGYRPYLDLHGTACNLIRCCS